MSDKVIESSVLWVSEKQNYLQWGRRLYNISLPVSNKYDECNTWNGMLHMDDLGSGKIIALSFKVTIIIHEHIFVLSIEK